MKILLALLLLAVTAQAQTNETYTIEVAKIWKHTNCVSFRPCGDFCTLIKYVDDGVTNDFHAAFVPILVRTNAVKPTMKDPPK